VVADLALITGMPPDVLLRQDWQMLLTLIQAARDRQEVSGG
jgi:hypothetical protein